MRYTHYLISLISNAGSSKAHNSDKLFYSHEYCFPYATYSGSYELGRHTGVVRS